MSKINWKSQEQIDKEKQEKKDVAEKISKIKMAKELATQIAIKRLVLANELEPEELEAMVYLYPEYQVGESYKADDLINYNGQLYQVIQSHTSQADWLPNLTPALYLSKMPEGVIPEWKQPTGSHDAYNIGDKVTFEGQVYESIINTNTWSPLVYPQGWKIVEI